MNIASRSLYVNSLDKDSVRNRDNACGAFCGAGCGNTFCVEACRSFDDACEYFGGGAIVS